MLTLLIAIYVIIDYAARMDEVQPRAGATLPLNSRVTVQAMLTLTGHGCRRVCAITPDDALLKVSCDTRQVAQACAVMRSYTITFAPSPEASR
jgi:hypothetical protein